jgi:pentatricopeptide repeat protein
VEALKLFEEMRAKKLNPDKVTFVSMLTGLAMLGDLEEGKRMHDLVRRYGYESDKSVANALLDMYAKCKSVENVQEVFDHLEDRDTVSWSCVIAAHAECDNHGKQALDHFDRMMCEGIVPVSYTFVGVFKACVAFGNVAEGKRIHSVVADTEHERNPFIASGLIDMYVKCDEATMAEQAFGRTSKQNLAAWNAVIAAFLRPDLAAKAFMVFQQMKLEGLQANAVTVASLLKACSLLQDVELGQKLHLFAACNELEPDTHVQNGLIDMYAKCGRLGMAECVFGGSSRRNASTWNGMISSCVRFKRPEDALILFQRMGEECIAADEVTLSTVFKACACLAVLQRGCRLHTLAASEEASKCLRGPDLCSSMINMYAKSGDMRSARAVFLDRAMPDPSLFTWNAMITCCAQHGKAEEALQLWQEMGRKSVAPNRITFLAVLAACGHGGRMEEGKACYLGMVGGAESHHHLVAEHLVCMVGLFGRAGQLERAKCLIQEIIPYESALTMAWRTVMRACSFHGDSALLSSIIGELEAELIAAD